MYADIVRQKRNQTTLCGRHLCKDLLGVSGVHAKLTIFSLLQPAYGWSELLITFKGMLAILSALQVFPQILPYLRAFGKKPFQRDEAFGGFDHVREYRVDGSLDGLGKSKEHCRFGGIRKLTGSTP
jgi:hypothetical protein